MCVDACRRGEFASTSAVRQLVATPRIFGEILIFCRESGLFSGYIYGHFLPIPYTNLRSGGPHHGSETNLSSPPGYARSNTRRALGTCNLGFEVLEDRRMLTVINWTNRNIFEHSPPPAVDNDNRFDSAFDIVRNGVLDTSRRDAAIAVVDAAIADWERVITSFADPSMVYNIKISMDSDGTTGTGISAVVDPNSILDVNSNKVLDTGLAPAECDDEHRLANPRCVCRFPRRACRVVPRPESE